jgi:hypothetical protein
VTDHRCARPGCLVEVPGYLLACAAHWRELPPPLQSAITRAWYRRRRRPGDDDATSAHLGLVLEAIDVWQEVRA